MDVCSFCAGADVLLLDAHSIVDCVRLSECVLVLFHCANLLQWIRDTWQLTSHILSYTNLLIFQLIQLDAGQSPMLLHQQCAQSECTFAQISFLFIILYDVDWIGLFFISLLFALTLSLVSFPSRSQFVPSNSSPDHSTVRACFFFLEKSLAIWLAFLGILR